MPKRDPIADPLPGDVFRNKGGTTLTIVDRFVSTGKKGSEMPGYFIRSEKPDGTVRYGSTAIVIIRHRKKTWTLVKASRSQTVNWDKVSRHPHADVDDAMRSKHGLPPRGTA